MALFEQFPYTNFHEINLDWVVAKIRELIEELKRNETTTMTEIERLNAAVNQMREYLNNFVENLDIRDEVNAKLDLMLADGSLEELINNSFNTYTAPVTVRVLQSDTTQNIAVAVLGVNPILIDCGTIDEAAKHARELIANGFRELRHVVITHYHYDHVGGLQGLIDNGIDFDGATFYLPPVPNFAVTDPDILTYYNEVNNIISAVGGTVYRPTYEGERVWINQNVGYYIDFYNVLQSQYYTDANFDYNNCSMVAVTGSAITSVCWAGDVSYLAQQYLSGILPHCEMLCVEHHALNAWCYEQYIHKISPKYCFTQNGTGDAGRGRLFILNGSRTQSVLQRLCIPNYCSSDNGAMVFKLSYGLETTARMFDGRKNITGAPSLLAAINYNYQESSNNITLMDLIKGMPHGSFVQTKVTSSSAVFDSFRDIFSGSITNVHFIMFKNQSAGYTGSSSTVDGFIMGFPQSGTSKNVGFFYATFSCPSNYSSIELTYKPINPSFPVKFSFNNGAFTAAAGTTQDILRISGDKLVSNVSGVLDFTAVINSDTEGTVYVRSDGSAVASMPVTAGGKVVLRNLVELSSGEEITITQSGANIDGYFIATIHSRYTLPKTFTDTTTTAEVFFNEYPTY